jgi:gluconokinase
MILIVMGVSGAGKSTIAEALARATGWQFVEGDDYHSDANRKKMHSGTPLTDEDRAPWLASLHEVLQSWASRGESGIMTCSALKQAYRDTLAKGLPEGSYHFVLLEVPRAELEKRLKERAGHFMSPQLLDSQLATLEDPKDALRIQADGSPDEIAGKILAQIRRP